MRFSPLSFVLLLACSALLISSVSVDGSMRRRLSSVDQQPPQPGMSTITAAPAGPAPAASVPSASSPSSPPMTMPAVGSNANNGNSGSSFNGPSSSNNIADIESEGGKIIVFGTARAELHREHYESNGLRSRDSTLKLEIRTQKRAIFEAAKKATGAAKALAQLNEEDDFKDHEDGRNWGMSSSSSSNSGPFSGHGGHGSGEQGEFAFELDLVELKCKTKFIEEKHHHILMAPVDAAAEAAAAEATKKPEPEPEEIEVECRLEVRVNGRSGKNQFGHKH